MTMLLSQLVEVNQKGIVANAVNIGMMDDPQMNLLLCEGFIFNYDVRKPESSTVGILDAIRRSYHSRNESNIHLMIQQYGKGKSHFAVAIANFFKQPFNSPEVQGILDQVEVATSSKNKAIAQGLKLFKQNQQHQHLVICLSGDRGGNIRKQFLQVLVKSLKDAGIEDSIARHICGEPLRYLESLDEPQRIRADEYLQSIGNPDGDLNCLVRLLKENNPAVIPTVKNLAYHLTSFNLDFSSHIDIEEILQDLLNNYCNGENAQFQGILILFDELNYYLQSWAADQIGAGGTALQNITKICANNKGKIALLSFTQIDPDRAVGISATAKESYLKISSRLKDSTYNPASSLELVLDNLLIQKENHSSWGDFCSRWQDTLLVEARIAYERRIKIYQENGWELEKFYRHLGKGCFPLHPLTAYLLCNLDFTQDRTAIQFIKSYVKNFIQDQQVEKAEQLNYIYPIALVDTFIENFSNYAVYNQYKQAIGLVAGSEDPDELLVLKALFLFHACSEKLIKSDREEHQEVIASLTGLPKVRLNAVLDKLEKTRDIIYYRPETKLYRFWEGNSPTEIEDDIEVKIKNAQTSFDTIIVHCREQTKAYLGNETITATQFVKDNKLVGADWQYEYKIYSIDGFIKALESDQTLRNIQQRGILAYVLAETQEELQEFRRNVDNYLSRSPLRNRIAVAIPFEETGDLARVLLKLKTLEEKDALEKQLYGAAYKQLFQRWQEQVDTQLERLLKSCTYHCVVLDKIPSTEQGKPQRIISALLQELYPSVPPVENTEKMRSDHVAGSKIVGFVSKQLFTESLTPQTLPPEESYKTVIDSIFVSCWDLLKKTSQKYIVQEPTYERISYAWNKISKIADLEGLPEKIVDLEKIWQALSNPPFGYSEYNFTILLAAWLAYHRKEVYLKGAVKLSAKKGESVSVQIQSLKDWATSDILNKPKDFVNIWIVKGKSKLIRRQKAEMPALPKSPIAYNQAQQYLEAVATFLESNELDSLEVDEVTRNRELVSAGVEQIDNWFQPVVEADALPSRANLETLLQLYPKLLQRPPAIDLRPDVISVIPTQQQRDRQNQALQAVNQKIAELVNAASQRLESLPTEEACNAYKIEIQRMIDQTISVTDLPPHLTDALQDAVRAANLRLIAIREQTKVRECLDRIQSVNRSLDDSSTQQDYANTRVEIETLARSIPNDTQEIIVQQILQSIDRRYKELTQQIEIWEERSSGVTSPQQILELIKEINRERRRFTEEASEQRLNTLQEQLDRELLKIQSRDNAEKLVRSELSSAQQKLQRIRDLPLSKLSEAFQVYQELVSSGLPTESTVRTEEYQKKLDGFKAQGRTVICEKFADIYNSKPKQLEDCESIKEQLQRSKIILEDAEDFADVKLTIEQAIENLEVKRQELQIQLEEQQKQAKNKQIMLGIRKYASATAKLNTIHLCEEAIEEIDNLEKQLDRSTQFATEIQQITQSIRDKINDYNRQWKALTDRVIAIDNLTDLSHIITEYAKLEFVFHNSVNYQQYQEIQQQIQYVKDDLEQIKNLEMRYQQSNSIASCNDLLETIASQQIVLHYSDRFRNKINTLEENLGKKIQNYTLEIREFEYNLEHISTVKKAQQFYEELAKKSGHFLNSDVEKQYQSINNELKLLIELLQLVELVRINTLESCQAQFNKIQHWQNSTENLTSRLRDRLQSIYEELEQNKLQLLQQEQTAAQEWLKELSARYTEIHQLLNDADKFEAANQIWQQIAVKKSHYVKFLNQKDLQSLEKIERQCIEEQGRNKANQILQLFRQLPRVQRQNLYERLAQYLLDSTEGGNG